jgi:hypothetical protein
VIQGSGELGLTDEPFPKLIVGGQLRAHDLQGHLPFQAKVDREVHDAHPAPSEQRFDVVRTEVGPNPNV